MPTTKRSRQHRRRRRRQRRKRLHPGGRPSRHLALRPAARPEMIPAGRVPTAPGRSRSAATSAASAATRATGTSGGKRAPLPAPVAGTPRLAVHCPGRHRPRLSFRRPRPSSRPRRRLLRRPFILLEHGRTSPLHLTSRRRPLRPREPHGRVDAGARNLRVSEVHLLRVAGTPPHPRPANPERRTDRALRMKRRR